MNYKLISSIGIITFVMLTYQQCSIGGDGPGTLGGGNTGTLDLPSEAPTLDTDFASLF